MRKQGKSFDYLQCKHITVPCLSAAPSEPQEANEAQTHHLEMEAALKPGISASLLLTCFDGNKHKYKLYPQMCFFTCTLKFNINSNNRREEHSSVAIG